MKLEKYPLFLFEDPSNNKKKEYTVSVPSGSQLLDISVLPDGLYTWYLIPELAMTEFQNDTFFITPSGEAVPSNTSFFKIIDVMMTTQEEQYVTMVYPIFKLNS